MFQAVIILTINHGQYMVSYCKVCNKTLSTTNTTEFCQKHYIEQRDISGENNPFFGKKHSEESVQKIREKNLGRKPINILKVIIDEIVYNSFTEASVNIGCAIATIRNRCNSNKFPNYKLYQEV